METTNTSGAAWYPQTSRPARSKDSNLVVEDFATMERGDTAALIIKSEPGMKPPVSARWLAKALELTFEEPHARTMLFVSPRFRTKWVERVVVALFDGPGDIVKGRITIDDMVAVPILRDNAMSA